MESRPTLFQKPYCLRVSAGASTAASLKEILYFQSGAANNFTMLCCLQGLTMAKKTGRPCASGVLQRYALALQLQQLIEAKLLGKGRAAAYCADSWDSPSDELINIVLAACTLLQRNGLSRMTHCVIAFFSQFPDRGIVGSTEQASTQVSQLGAAKNRLVP